MKRPILFLTLSLFFLTFITALTPASANVSPLENSRSSTKSLIVEEGQKHTLETGNHRFEVLELKAGSTLYVIGSTSILVNKFIAGKGSEIRYKEGTAPPGTHTLSINALDASGIDDLSVIANGKSAPHHSGTAPNGQPGRNAKHCDFGDFDGKKATPGGDGTVGKHGRAGENALHVALRLPFVKPGADIFVEAIGGSGGNGQQGGNGGRGGGDSNCHDPRDGGNGGRGGNGGHGGAAGKVQVLLVIAPEDIANKENIIDAVHTDIEVAAGEGGEPGLGGHGGRDGEANRPIRVNTRNADPGNRGPSGKVGPRGKGPIRDGQPGEWVVVDAMDFPTYQRYIANIWSDYKPSQ